MGRLLMASWRLGYCLFALAVALTTRAVAIPPNPLQSAYWRFEEGTVGSRVSPRNADVVLDSINDNDMRAFQNDAVDAAPTYVSTVPPTALRSALANNLALDFIPNQDLFALEQEINNGIIAPGGGFTVEAAFNTNNPVRFAAIVSKEGQPGGSRPVQTFALKTRGDNGHLMVEQWDANANLVQVSSIEPIVASQWYYAAVVNDGSTLSLYLDSNDGVGYELQGSVAVNGALYQANPERPNWDSNWTIGRGEFGGSPADWFDGIIDEVRLTNMALSPMQFLFDSPVPGLMGDYNNNGSVDAADYVLWRKNPAAFGGQQGYNVWRANFGQTAPGGGAAAVPEPTSIVLCVFFILAVVNFSARHRPSALQTARVFSIQRMSMKTNQATQRVGYCLFALVLASAAFADVAPNPLESAYWRFEEGAAFSQVPANSDVVLDSINENHMRAFCTPDCIDVDARPTYVSTVPPTPLRSGLPNNLALDFIPGPPGGGDDLFTLFNDDPASGGVAKNINNGIIAPGGGFTVEAAFNTNNPLRWAAVVGKDARPGGTNHPVQTLVLKTRGDNGHLFFEQWDGQSNLVGVNSLAPLVASQWYYAAAVNDGSTLSLYLDSNDGAGYQLQGSVAVAGALFQGNPANPLWDASWTVGRGQFGGNPTDWFDGIIDEVRVSNTALAPSEFLFASAGAASGTVVPEPTSLLVYLLGIVCGALCRQRRRLDFLGRPEKRRTVILT